VDDGVTAPAERDAGVVQGIILALVPCMVVMTVVAALPIIPAMLKAYAATPGIGELAPMSVVLPTLTIAISSLGAGVLGEKIGRRRLLAISTAVYAVAAPLPFWLNDFNLVIASRALAGIALGGMTVSGVGLTADYFTGAARQRWLAIQGGAGAASGVVVSAISGELGEINWRLPFLLLLAGVALFLAIVLLPARGQVAESHETATEAVAADAGGPVPWGDLIAIFALGILSSMVLFPPVYELGLLLQEKSLGSTSLTGFTTSVLAAGAVGGAMVFGLMRRLPAPIKMALTFIVGGLGILVLATARQVAPLMAGAAAVGVSQGLTAPILSLWLLDRTPERVRGRAVGVFNTIFFTAQFAGPVFARWVADHSPSTSASLQYFELAALAVVVVIGASTLVGPRLRPAASRAAG
jgi:MFS family permease